MATLVVVSAVFVSNNISFADDVVPSEKTPINNEKMKQDFKQQYDVFNKRNKHRGPSKEEMQAKKLEFEKRLNLTEEQKKKIDENRAKDREVMKPIFEEMKAKRHAIKMIDFDASLSQEQKQAKKEELKAQLKELRSKADSIREANMKNFEALLDEKQKKEFSKIQEEQEKEMEKRRAEFIKERKNKKGYDLPVQPKPLPPTRVDK